MAQQWLRGLAGAVESSDVPSASSVRAYIEPKQAVREDFPPGSPEHEHFCER